MRKAEWWLNSMNPHRIGVHRWGRYELRQKGDVYVSYSHAHAVRRGVGTIRRCNRDGYGADVMHRSCSEGLHLRLGAGRVSTAMNNGITNALVGGIGHNRICVHQPAQFKDEEHNHENNDDH